MLLHLVSTLKMGDSAERVVSGNMGHTTHFISLRSMLCQKSCSNDSIDVSCHLCELLSQMHPIVLHRPLAYVLHQYQWPKYRLTMTSFTPSYLKNPSSLRHRQDEWRPRCYLLVVAYLSAVYIIDPCLHILDACSIFHPTRLETLPRRETFPTLSVKGLHTNGGLFIQHTHTHRTCRGLPSHMTIADLSACLWRIFWVRLAAFLFFLAFPRFEILETGFILTSFDTSVVIGAPSFGAALFAPSPTVKLVFC